jgi:hypothetical protein
LKSGVNSITADQEIINKNFVMVDTRNPRRKKVGVEPKIITEN